MGIACLYGYLDKSFGGQICCTLVDALSGRWSLEQVIQMIEDTFPDVICITAKTMQVEQTIELLEFFRRTSCILICGGNHVSVEPDIFIESGADFAIVGEGEKSLRTIIKCLLDNNMEKIEEDNRIIYDKNELSEISIRKKIFISNYVENFRKADEQLGKPDWSIFDIKLYNENIHINKSVPALQVMASRGCPYKCSFCSSYLTWGTYVKYRPAQMVVDEIVENIKKYSINDFHFYDDNLMLNREWVIEFLNIVEKSSYSFNWICLSRPEIIFKNSDLLFRMKKNGCKGFELGFETYSPEVYKKMNKKNNYDSFFKAYSILQENDFEMIEFLIMGFYIGETIETLYETYLQLKKFMKGKNLFTYSRYFATPFIGTEFYQIHLQHGHNLFDGNRYKYAVYLNYMPDSFLDFCGVGYYIDANSLELLCFAYGELDHIIYRKEFNQINNKLTPSQFAYLFNRFMSERKTVRDLNRYIADVLELDNILCVEEYVARMIEFSVRLGAMRR